MDTGAPLNLELMEVGTQGKEAIYNLSMQTINGAIGGVAGVAFTAKNTARVATTAALTATYANGTLGVGATLTNAGAMAAFAHDGITGALNDRVLVKDQASSFQNGIYTLTTLGSGAINWVLTRATDFDNTPTGEVSLGAFVLVAQGTANALTAWMQTGTGPWTMGTTAITFTPLFSVATYTDEQAQDAIGAMVADTATIDLVYTDATPSLTAAVIDDSITYAKLQPTAAESVALGRGQGGGAGDVQELTFGTGLAVTGTVISATVSAYTDEQAQDAIGAMVDSSLVYVDATPSLGVVAASDTLAGKVELATGPETSAGTSASLAVTPDGLAGSIFGTFLVGVAIGDPLGSQVTTGDSKAYFSIPPEMNGMNLVSVGLSISTVSSSGLPTYQVRRVRGGTPADMLTTKASVDASEVDSATAAAAPVIDAANDDVLTGDQVHFDKDVAGTGELGDFMRLGFRLP